MIKLEEWVLAFRHASILTGSIGTGKSTVCKILEQNHFKIIDADVVAKKQLELHAEEVIELFGDVICENGTIQRKRLADIIFSSKKEKQKLNNLLHPLVQKEIKKQADLLDKLEKPYIVDIPLFFESDGGYECPMSVVVYTPAEKQLERLMSRDGIGEVDALKRINSQIDIQTKKEMADWVIDNSSDLVHLKEETKRFIDFLRSKNASIKV